MMANYPRKILYAEPEKPGSDKDFSPDCYACYAACPQHCYISPPPPQLVSEPDPGKNHVSTVLILMLCVFGIAFLFLWYLTMVRIRLRNSRRRRNPETQQNSMADFLDENQGPVLDHHIWYIRTVGLPQSVIDSIGSFLYKKGDGLVELKDCSICLSEFEENEMLRLLPKCRHAFHGGCIDTWLRSHQNCPVCRAPILVATRPSQTESSTSENELPTRSEAETDESRETIMPIQEDDHELRRSVSLDFPAAAAAAAVGGEGCSDTKMEVEEMGVKRNSSIYRLIKSASCVQSLQMGPVSMKRSFSFTGSGKRSLRNNTRSLESIEIPNSDINDGQLFRNE